MLQHQNSPWTALKTRQKPVKTLFGAVFTPELFDEKAHITPQKWYTCQEPISVLLFGFCSVLSLFLLIWQAVKKIILYHFWAKNLAKICKTWRNIAIITSKRCSCQTIATPIRVKKCPCFVKFSRTKICYNMFFIKKPPRSFVGAFLW